MLGDLRPQHLGRRTKTSEAIGDSVSGRDAPDDGRTVPFSSAHKWSGVSADGDGFRGVFALGAPEFLGPQLGERRTAVAARRLGERRACACSSSPTARTPRRSARQTVAALPPGVKPVAWLGFTDELRPKSTGRSMASAMPASR